MTILLIHIKLSAGFANLPDRVNCVERTGISFSLGETGLGEETFGEIFSGLEVYFETFGGEVIVGLCTGLLGPRCGSPE